MTNSNQGNGGQNPLASMDECEDDLVRRYPDPDNQRAEGTGANTTDFQSTNPDKQKDIFWDYDLDAQPSVREFYRLNQTGQTFDFVNAKRQQYLNLENREMSVWEAMEYLNTLVDDSDSDTDLAQIQHLLRPPKRYVAMDRRGC